MSEELIFKWRQHIPKEMLTEYDEDFGITTQRYGSLFPVGELMEQYYKRRNGFLSEEIRNKIDEDIRRLIADGTPTEFLNDELRKVGYEDIFGN
jgi:hypothetical protein